MAADAAPPLSISLDPATGARMEHLAVMRRKSPLGLMREAIEQYIDREEKREAFRQETLAAWQEYQATGHHVPGQEVEAWLDKLADGEDLDPPQCRG